MFTGKTSLRGAGRLGSRGRFGVREADCVVGLANAEAGYLACKLGSDPRRRTGVGEENRSKRNRLGTGRDQLERVASGRDPSHAHDRQARRRVAGIDGRERNRLQRRSREASRAAGQAGPQCLLVEGEAEDRIHEREPVRTRLLRGAGDLGDVRRRRRELRVERLSGRCPRGGDDLPHARRDIVDVRAGDVELDRLDLGPVVEPVAEMGVVGNCEGADRDPDRHAELAQPRQRVREEAIDSRICQPDRVQHSVLDLGDSRRRVSIPRQRSHGLGHEGIEGARHLRRCQGIEATRSVQELHAATASAASTGPSTHRRLISPAISTAQP